MVASINHKEPEDSSNAILRCRELDIKRPSVVGALAFVFEKTNGFLLVLGKTKSEAVRYLNCWLVERQPLDRTKYLHYETHVAWRLSEQELVVRQSPCETGSDEIPSKEVRLVKTGESLGASREVSSDERNQLSSNAVWMRKSLIWLKQTSGLNLDGRCCCKRKWTRPLEKQQIDDALGVFVWRTSSSSRSSCSDIRTILVSRDSRDPYLGGWDKVPHRLNKQRTSDKVCSRTTPLGTKIKILALLRGDGTSVDYLPRPYPIRQAKGESFLKDSS